MRASPSTTLDAGITVTMLRHMQSVQNFLGKAETAHLSEQQILLTATGREQGRVTAEYLRMDYLGRGVSDVLVLISPAKRTTETGRLIAESGSDRLRYHVHTMDSLRETCLVPRELEAEACRAMPDPGLFGRHLMESPDLPGLGAAAVLNGLVPISQLKARLQDILRSINALAGETGFQNILVISHQATNRLLAGNQFLRIPLGRMDGFEKFDNDNVWHFDGAALWCLYPMRRLIGSAGE